ncbi:MAG: hypothetical protein EXR58_02150 [Chloroflexi bacterium]|nr:hypothetical protein [Chloroflexota bacterium]
MGWSEALSDGVSVVGNLGHPAGRGWIAVAGASTLLGVALAISVAFQLAYADRIVAGVKVLGLDLGGQTPPVGRALLETSAAQLGQQLVTLKAGGREWQLSVVDLGTQMDADAMVQQAYEIGRAGNPLQRVGAQWSALFFGTRFVSPVVQFDSERQDAVLQRIAAEIDQPSLNARIDPQISQDGRVSFATVPERPGSRLRISESAQRVREAISRGLPATVDLIIGIEQPGLTTANVESVRSRASQMAAGPVALSYGSSTWDLSPQEIARTIAFQSAGGADLRIAVDPDTLSRVANRIDAQLGQPATNARFDWNGGSPRPIRASQDGMGVDFAALAQTLQDRLPAERSFAIPLTTTRALVTADDGAKLGLKELIKQGRTTFPGATAEKQFNIKLASSRLDGTVVAPGELFSFNKEVGPTTLEAGFKTGWGITLSDTGAHTIPSVAGGICQVATTLFQPIFHAGYAIEERNYHLYWIQSYGQAPLGMKGLDATVDEAYGLDLRFINNTTDYLLVGSRVEGTTLLFDLYGTKPTWDVKIGAPTISNVVPTDPTLIREVEPTMPPGRSLQVETAQDGFDVTVNRTVTLGDDVRRLPLRSHYLPAHNVILFGGELPAVEADPSSPTNPASPPGSNQNTSPAVTPQPNSATPVATAQPTNVSVTAQPTAGQPTASATAAPKQTQPIATLQAPRP